MSQVTQYGYDKIRQHIQSSFTFVNIANADGEVKRFSNAAITYDSTDNKVVYAITVDNADGSLTDITVNQANVFEDATSTDAIAGVTFSDFKFESTEDTLTLTIKINIPTV